MQRSAYDVSELEDSSLPLSESLSEELCFSLEVEVFFLVFAFALLGSMEELRARRCLFAGVRAATFSCFKLACPRTLAFPEGTAGSAAAGLSRSANASMKTMK